MGELEITLAEYEEIAQRRSQEDLNRLVQVVGDALGVQPPAPDTATGEPEPAPAPFVPSPPPGGPVVVDTPAPAAEIPAEAGQ